MPLYVVGAARQRARLYWGSSPWIAGKAFATASPAIPFAALIACVLLVRRGRLDRGRGARGRGRRGVLWTNVLQYHDAWLAPRSQLGELSAIGDRFAGDAPALMTEYQPYGVRHFLRKLDPEGAAELRFRHVTLRNGEMLDKGLSANIDDFQLDGILVYRTLVLRTSPVESRPPSVYRLVSKGKWYEVWQRPEPLTGRILEHLPLGTDLQPAAVPSCADVLRLARLAGSSGFLAAVERPPAVDVDLSKVSHPPNWVLGQSGELTPVGAGTVKASVQVPASGRYGIWVGGAFRDRLDLLVDGNRVATARNQLNNYGQYTPLAVTRLARGTHEVTLRYGGPDLHPGSGGVQFALGPLVLSRTTADLPVTEVRAADARSLCGKSLDWIEARAG